MAVSKIGKKYILRYYLSLMVTLLSTYLPTFFLCLGGPITIRKILKKELDPVRMK